MTMLMVVFLLPVLSSTPNAVMYMRAFGHWLAMSVGNLPTAAGHWVAFRATQVQFGLLVWGLAAAFVLPSLVEALLIAPVKAFVPVQSLCIWAAETCLFTVAAVNVYHLQAYAREQRWLRAARMINGPFHTYTLPPQ